jgi:hypothetical protein
MLGCKFSSESIQCYVPHCGLYSTVPVEDVVDTVLKEGSWITMERERERAKHAPYGDSFYDLASQSETLERGHSKVRHCE